MSRADLSKRVVSDDPVVHADALIRQARLVRVPGKTAHQIARGVALAAYNDVDEADRRAFLTLVLNEIDRQDAAAGVQLEDVPALDPDLFDPEPAEVPSTRYTRFMAWVARPADKWDWLGLAGVVTASAAGFWWWLA